MRRAAVIITSIAIAAAAAPARAETYGGVEFPGGAASFADQVVSFAPVIRNGEPNAPFLDPLEALGIPDYSAQRQYEGFVSLGDGGTITLRFSDNALTGSGSTAKDLWIFEVGTDVEDTFVWVSADGATWHSVGIVGGSTAGVDLDAYGFDTGDSFHFVRLTDHPDRDAQIGIAVGADIDAVGAISTDLAPTALGDAYATPAYRTLTVAAPGVLANDSDPEAGALVASLDATTSNGTLQLAPDGSFTYEPDPGFVGSDAFTYHVSDGSGNASAAATVTIDVTGCGEGGVAPLDGTPAEGAASGVVHEHVEPLANGVDPAYGAMVHEVDCTVVVPLEDEIDRLVP